jgi:hypothetical protein
MKITHRHIVRPGLPLACITALLIAAPAFAAAADAPVQTIPSGSVSMSAQPSFDILAYLKTKFSPEDMQLVNDFLRENVMSITQHRAPVMTPVLAHKLYAVREQAKTSRPVAAKSIDLMFGPAMNTALQAAK